MKKFPKPEKTRVLNWPSCSQTEKIYEQKQFGFDSLVYRHRIKLYILVNCPSVYQQYVIKCTLYNYNFLNFDYNFLKKAKQIHTAITFTSLS